MPLAFKAFGRSGLGAAMGTFGSIEDGISRGDCVGRASAKKNRHGGTRGSVRPYRFTFQRAPWHQPGCSLSSHPTNAI